MKAGRLVLVAAVFSVFVLAACKTHKDSSAAQSFTRPDGSVWQGCVTSAQDDDGYQNVPADASRVKRMIVGPNGTIVEDKDKVVTPTQPEIDASTALIEKYVAAVNAVPAEARRPEIYFGGHVTPEPYCLFHPAGQPIYGTVVLFHGFNDRPLQQAKLASYLFHNGFNVFNAFLVNEYMVPGTKFWPKTKYSPLVMATMAKKLANESNRTSLMESYQNVQAGNQPSPQDIARIDAVLKPEYSVAMLMDAWWNPAGDSFRNMFNVREFNSPLKSPLAGDYLDFLRDAWQRIQDVAPIKGPIFVGGLSVGGAVALGLGEIDGGQRIRGIVAHAPWLRSIDENANMKIAVVGPLDDFLPDNKMSWVNHKIEFSGASIAANLALGHWVMLPPNVDKLAHVPTALIMTDAEDSANNETTEKYIFSKLSTSATGALHRHFFYKKDLIVGHAMTDPENYRDDENGHGYNRYWRTLYQESFRFYTQGTIDPANLSRRAEDPALPKVACRITYEFKGRCNE